MSEFDNPFLTVGAIQAREADAAFSHAETLEWNSEERSREYNRGCHLLKRADISSRLAVAYALNPSTQLERGSGPSITVNVAPDFNPATIGQTVSEALATYGRRGGGAGV